MRRGLLLAFRKGGGISSLWDLCLEGGLVFGLAINKSVDRVVRHDEERDYRTVSNNATGEYFPVIQTYPKTTKLMAW